MKIVIVGAGRVGATLAKYLTLEHNDISIIDLDSKRLQKIQERYDVQTVAGHGAHPAVLERAGINDADILVAVSNQDELNMIACHLAAKLYNTPTKIARIRSGEYTKNSRIFEPDVVDIDLIISPEQLVANAIKKLIQYPGTLQVLDFAEGRVYLTVVRAEAGAILVNNSIASITEYIPELTPEVIALYRNNSALTITAQTIIEAEDEVFFLGANHLCQQMIGLLRINSQAYKRLMLAGGGHIGLDIAKALEDHYSVKLIEHNNERAERIANELHKTIVLSGDTADKLLLLDENIEETDFFCAVTNDDEANIMASLLAKKMGVRKVLTLVNRSSYVELIEGGEIDVVISPQQTTLSGFLRHIRKGDIVQVHTLRHGAAEAIEIIAHGKENSSKVVGRTINELPLPKGVRIGAIVRDNKVIMAAKNPVLESEDHVIVFLPDAAKIHEVETLFQVSLSFF